MFFIVLIIFIKTKTTYKSDNSRRLVACFCPIYSVIFGYRGKKKKFK